MKYLVAIFLFGALTQGPARGVEFDASLLPLCQQLANAPNDDNLRTRFSRHESISVIKKGFSDKYRLSFEQISEQKERIDHYASSLPDLQRSLPQMETHATAFLGENALPSDLKINLVCGMRWDGFGFLVDGKLQLFVNLSLVVPDFFPSLIRHELWHIAFRSQYPATADNYGDSMDPLKRLAYVILNEGVGHYYSFQRRVEPSISYDNWPERTGRIFLLLHENVPLLNAATDPDEKKKLLFSSHAGVPFWKKWGALPGAIITYRLKHALGTEALRKTIRGGPCQFLTQYQLEAQRRPKWQLVPDELLTAACAVPDR